MTNPTPVKTHTPLPWQVVLAPEDWFVDTDSGNSYYWIGSPEFEPVAAIVVTESYDMSERLEANKALIVRAVNNHADLVQLAHQYASDLRHPPSADSVERRLERIAAVLAKVGEV